MAIQQKVQFMGMDQDAGLRYMQPGSYRYALNVHVGSTKGENLGAVENVQGNTLVSTTLPVGTNKVIGAYEERTTNSVFYFLYNSNADHGIYRYFSDSNTITKVFEWSGLNFQLDKLITGVGYIGNTLFWTDNFSPQRSLHIPSIPSFQLPYVEEYISLIKRPPNLQPTCVTGYDATFPNNYLYQKTFQFRTQYVYIDNTVSTLSPISKLAYPDINRATTGAIIFPTSSKFRYTAGSGVDTPLNNTSSYKATPSNQNYIDVTLNTNDITSTNSIYGIAKINILVREGNNGKWGIFKTITQAELLATQTYRFYNDRSTNIVSDELGAKLFDSIPILSGSLALMKNRVFLANNIEGYNNPPPITFTSTPIYAPFNQSSSIIGTQIFKNRGSYGIGIVFYDKYMRSSGVIQSTPTSNPLTRSTARINSTNFYILLAGIPGQPIVFNQPYCTGVKIDLPNNYTIPDWAHYYSVVRTKNIDFGYFIRIIPTKIDVNATTKVATMRYDAGTPDRTVYNFVEGDMLNISTGFGVFTTKILGIDSNGDLEIDAKMLGFFATNTNQYIYGAEIYSPLQRSETELYYEVGSVFNITNPGTVGAQFSNLSINITGDVYLTMRNFIIKHASGETEAIIPVESYGLYSDTYEENDSSIGRVNVIIPDGTQELRSSSIRFSNNYIQGSKINGTSTFDAGDIETINNDYGPINKLQVATNNQSEGDVMLAIFTNAIASIYVGEALIRDNKGAEVLATSSNVIGSWRILRGVVGTTNPESVVQQDGSVYGFDVTRGIAWRYAQDGITFISERSMKTYFYNKSRALIANGTYRVFGAYDPYFEEYILSFDVAEGQETVAYSKDMTRWTTFYSYIPEWYSKINTKMLSFLNGEVWVHATNSLYNNFYGNQYNAKIKAVCNIEPSKEKILESINTESQDAWIATSITTPEGQESNLQASDYFKLANAYNANVLRDINTPNITSPKIPILHGDWMRSSAFEVEMTNEETLFSPLYFANFKVIPSERSNK